MPVTRSGFYWTVSPALIADNLDRWWIKFLVELDEVLEEFGGKIKDYAKANHPWENITGAAERSINAQVIKGPNSGRTVILFADDSIDREGAEHVFWMEVRFNGQYAIIRVTLEAHYDDLMSAIRRLVG